MIVVVIVTYRNVSDVMACLDALDRQSLQGFEVVICENGDDADLDLLKQAVDSRTDSHYNTILIHASDNPGYAGGINRVIKARKGASYYWVLNPDTIPHDTALERLFERLNDGDCDAVGGVVYLPDNKVRSCGGAWSRWTARVRGLGLGYDLEDIPDRTEIEPQLSFISGACILASSEFVHRAGPMREEYFLYAEEVEWCLRAKAKGLRLGYCPNALIRHDQGSTTGSGADADVRPPLPIYLDERNRLLVVRDTFPIGLVTAIPSSLILLTYRYFIRGNFAQWRIAIAGWWAGVMGQRGKWISSS